MVAPMLPALTFSDDQAEAYDRVSAELFGMGVDLENAGLEPRRWGGASPFADLRHAGDRVVGRVRLSF